MAVKFDEDVEWIKQKKEYILPVCYMRDFLQSSSRLFNLYFNQEQQPAPIPALSVLTPLGSGTSLDAHNTATSSSATTFYFSMVSSHTNSPFKDKIIASLSIPVELTNHKNVNLGHAWQKYKACLVLDTLSPKTSGALRETRRNEDDSLY